VCISAIVDARAPARVVMSENVLMKDLPRIHPTVVHMLADAAAVADDRRAVPAGCPLAAQPPLIRRLQAHSSLESRARLQAHTSLEKTVD
jgi:hypothetical protein